MQTPRALLLLSISSLFAATVLGCGAKANTEAGTEPVSAPKTIEPLERSRLLQPRTGDWDGILESRVIRALVVANKTNYFIDQGRARGMSADALQEWEKQLNQELELGSRPMRVAAIPVTYDKLIPFLAEGRAEIALGSLTVTPERAAQVDFSVPAVSAIDEIVVTHSEGPRISQLSDLSGLDVHVRESSSYYESLQNLNEVLREKGLAPVEIKTVPEYVDTEGLLEMVNAELIPITIADNYLAQFWSQVFPNLVVHEDVAVASGREIAWAVRKGAPGLKKRVDSFIQANKQGTLLGNTLINRYFKSAKYVEGAAQKEDRERFLSMLDLFETYGQQYDFDSLMLAAQGYQESGLDQSVRSPVGAIGVMQVMPSTAADKAVSIANIEILENNVHAGTKYLRHLIDTYFNKPGIDRLNRMLFSFAGYNAGPNRINRLREEAKTAGYDPNVWFDNVELIVAEEVGREPVAYVGNIVKYYTAYTLILEKEKLKEKEQLKQQ